jgi:hypothetical protein
MYKKNSALSLDHIRTKPTLAPETLLRYSLLLQENSNLLKAASKQCLIVRHVQQMIRL